MLSLQKEIRSLGDAERARMSASFFKTGKDEYGEGDVFLGLSVPQSRSIVKKYGSIPFASIEVLLASKYHEERLIGLLFLVSRFEAGGEAERKMIFDFYLAHIDRVNNWDLVDLSAPQIVGAYLFGKSTASLDRLIISENLWKRRVAMVSSFWFLKHGEAGVTLRLAERLLDDPEDLMHKAAGWMLREMGKRVSRKELESFLKRYADRMPRTMLRYAIEHFSETERQVWLAVRRKNCKGNRLTSDGAK
jgi:3-methyladenine DNA glycosylase AlkD